MWRLLYFGLEILDFGLMQNPGALVTVKTAIKPPGFNVFLLNEVQIIVNGC